MSFLIGIDGGGTKTHCIAADLNGNVEYECFGGPSNFLMLGTEVVSDTLLQLIDECIEKLKISYLDISYIVLGTTGAGRRTDAEKLENAFNSYLKTKNISLKFRIESDARIAVEGAFSGKPGSILIAGTGSIMFGKDINGVIHRVGGFGRFIGDEGSGYVIGKRGLAASAKQFDGRGDKTLISNLLLQKFKIESPEQLITEIYKNNFDIASAARIVLEAAELEDEEAMNIIESETDELILHLKAMYKMINQDTLDVAFIGGLISNTNIYSDTFRQKIKEQLPYINIKTPDHSPEYGAILMAKNFLNNKI